jgi:hypothetical protein
MIHINLLPPELRKRRTGSISPVAAGFAASCILCLAIAGGLAFISWKIGKAEERIADLKIEIETKQQQAEAVKKIEAAIDDFQKQRDSIVNLLAQKVYWAHTIDEFVNTLNGPWLMPDIQVRCSELTIAPAASTTSGPRQSAKAGDQAVYNFSWRYRLFGKERALHGDYVNAFFRTLSASRLWNEHGFVGTPAESYRGHDPRWNPTIERVVIESSMDWRRVKQIGGKGTAK